MNITERSGVSQSFGYTFGVRQNERSVTDQFREAFLVKLEAPEIEQIWCRRASTAKVMRTFLVRNLVSNSFLIS